MSAEQFTPLLFSLCRSISCFDEVGRAGRDGCKVRNNPPSARGAVRPSIAARPSVHSAMRGMTGAFPAHIGSFRMSRLGDHRRAGFPVWWGDAPYVPNYYPSEYAAPYAELPYTYPSIENFSERSRPIVTYQPGCSTDTQKVPSETGGEHTIHITRCY